MALSVGNDKLISELDSIGEVLKKNANNVSDRVTARISEFYKKYRQRPASHEGEKEDIKNIQYELANLLTIKNNILVLLAQLETSLSESKLNRGQIENLLVQLHERFMRYDNHLYALGEVDTLVDEHAISLKGKGRNEIENLYIRIVTVSDNIRKLFSA